MQAFIMDRRDFTVKSRGQVAGYDIKKSIFDAVSSVTVSDLSPTAGADDYIFLDGMDFLGVISDITAEGTAARLSVAQPESILSRQLIYTPRAYTYLEDNLSDLIQANFINCPDAFYAYPYMTAEALTHTAAQVLPDLDDNGVYTLKSYAAKIRRLYNIFLDWGVRRQKLTLTIAMRVKVLKKTDFGNPNYILTEQSFSGGRVTKVTTLCEENGQIKDWILLADGSIVNNPPLNGRIAGEWTVLNVRDAAEAENSAKNELLKNEYSHKIAFRAHKNEGFRLYDRLQIRLEDKLFYSYITETEEQSGSDYVNISCGELQTKYPFLTAD